MSLKTFYAIKNGLCFCRLTMEHFVEKPINNLAFVSFCTKLEVSRGMAGGASHNSIQFVTVEKLQKSPNDNCLCSSFTSALRYAEIN